MTNDKTAAPAAPRPWRVRLALCLVVLATITTTLGIFGGWLKTVALESNSWSSISGEALTERAVRTAVSDELLDRLYTFAKPQDVLEEQLPPALRPLAGPVTGASRVAAERGMERVLSSQEFQDAWTEANRDAHRELMAIIEGNSKVVDESNGSVELDIRPLLVLVAEPIGIDPDKVRDIPQEYAYIDLGLDEELEQVRTVVRTIRATVYALWAASIALMAIAFALAWPSRLRIARWWATGAMVSGLLLHALRAIGGPMLAEQVARIPQNQAAADDLFQIVTQAVGSAAWVLVIVGAFVRALVWLLDRDAQSRASRSAEHAAALAARYPYLAHLPWAAPLVALVLLEPTVVIDHALMLVFAAAACGTFVVIAQRRGSTADTKDNA